MLCMIYLLGIKKYQEVSKMKKILNGLFLGIKWILFIASFSLTFYIVLSMYDIVNKSMIESID